KPTGWAFALEGGRTFRHERAADYKAGRTPIPDALRLQLPAYAELQTATGASRHRAPGFEADDVIATLAARLDAQGEAVRVVSGDRDVLQLATDRVSVRFIGRRGQPHVIYDEKAVRDRFGVHPSSLPFYIALVGDPADNLPKLPGIGPKTASRLVARWGQPERLLDHLDDVTPARLRATLDAHRGRLLSNHDLARLRSDVTFERPAAPLTAPLDEGAKARLADLFAAWEFRSLAARLAALASPP
ncbi:MAG: 5'-3' exonuclease H3TH domain-containing protein, partial [Myxococcota bacterium]